MIQVCSSKMAKKSEQTFHIPDAVPKNGIFTNMTYLRGDNPWSFWLGFSETKNCNIFVQVLENRKTRRPLRPLNRLPPSKGDFVCAMHTNSIIRCKVILVDTVRSEVKCLNVDTGEEVMVKDSLVWTLDEDVAFIQAQAIKCCLKGDFGNRMDWSESMGEMFEMLLKKGDLIASVHDIIKGNITKYVVDVNVIDETALQKKASINVSLWIHACLLSSFDTSLSTSSMDSPPSSDLQLDHEQQQNTLDDIELELSEGLTHADDSPDLEITEVSHKLSDFKIDNSRKISLKPSTSACINRSAIHSPNILPINFRDKVHITYIISPGEFYVTLPSSATVLQKMREDMSLLYDPMDITFTDKEDAQKQIHTYCACFQIDKGCWIRGKVINWNPDMSRDHVTVFCIDKGNTINVSWRFLRCLQDQFHQHRSLAIKCHLANITSSINSTSRSNVTEWPEKAIKTFHAILDLGYPYDIIVVGHNRHVNPLSQAVILSYSEDFENINVNNELVSLDCGVRATDGVEDTQEEEDIQVAAWNPMQEEFFSGSNAYNVAVEDPLYRVFGYRPEDESRICRYFGFTGRCPRPPGACQKEHILFDPAGYSRDKIPVFCYTINSLALPERGSVVILQVSFIKEFCTFYAVILTQLEENEGETLESLNKYINQEENVRNMKQLTTPPCEGQILLAKFYVDGRFYRARVIDVDGEGHVHVFFIDYGNIESVSERDLREIDTCYLHMAPQALECELANFIPYDKEYIDISLATEYFTDLIYMKRLRARVTDTDATGSMKVLLYRDKLDVGHTLAREGFGTLADYALQSITSQRLIPG